MEIAVLVGAKVIIGYSAISIGAWDSNAPRPRVSIEDVSNRPVRETPVAERFFVHVLVEPHSIFVCVQEQRQAEYEPSETSYAESVRV